MEFDWKNVLSSRSPDQILCLWGKAFWTKDQSIMLQRSIKKSIDSSSHTVKIGVVLSRDDYIQRHSYEGLFFQAADNSNAPAACIRVNLSFFRKAFNSLPSWEF